MWACSVRLLQRCFGQGRGKGRSQRWGNGLAHARESWRELELCLDLGCNMRKKSPINRLLRPHEDLLMLYLRTHSTFLLNSSNRCARLPVFLVLMTSNIRRLRLTSIKPDVRPKYFSLISISSSLAAHLAAFQQIRPHAPTLRETHCNPRFQTAVERFVAYHRLVGG